MGLLHPPCSPKHKAEDRITMIALQLHLQLPGISAAIDSCLPHPVQDGQGGGGPEGEPGGAGRGEVETRRGSKQALVHSSAHNRPVN
jgi:hypothetical protein